jgi:hypothetical protein
LIQINGKEYVGRIERDAERRDRMPIYFVQLWSVAPHHEVRLMPAPAVKAYVKRNKNDFPLHDGRSR